MITLAELNQTSPIIPVLRGLESSQAEAVGEILMKAGLRCLEVPLNSPDPFTSIAILTKKYGDRALIGAGTVLNPEDVVRVREAGGRLIVMPHSDPAVITEAKKQGLYCVPGVFTPTEAFRALALGADALKFFPAITVQPSGIKAMREVLPKNTLIYATGGINPNNIAEFIEAGCTGVGLGGDLFRPSYTLDQIRDRAVQFMNRAKEIGLVK
jgi:2-dehydro-3-deoxyphosphogalactonate aldolase